VTTPIGVQLTPWNRADELVAAGERLSDVVDTIWVQDQMLARNVYVTLAALAHAGCGVGTNVTYPVGRNPIEMAASLGTIGELVKPGRTLTVGMGTGGAVVNSLFRKQRRVALVREAIQLMKGLWNGDEVLLDEFPTHGALLGYKPEAVARLTFDVESPPDIVLAGVGPQILKVAGEYADGLISAANFPTHSPAAFASGRFEELSGHAELRAMLEPGKPFRFIYGINMSVAADRSAARSHARRQLALTFGNPALWPALEAVGLDIDAAEDVKRAFDEGLGIEGAADRVPDHLTDGLLVSGTPDECIEAAGRLQEQAAAHGYTEFYIGGPLGPDPAEAAELLRDRVLPALWPDRARSAAR
jgi:5,10-methylenetetrahydromethanopterin reductase